MVKGQKFKCSVQAIPLTVQQDSISGPIIIIINTCSIYIKANPMHVHYTFSSDVPSSGDLVAADVPI